MTTGRYWVPALGVRILTKTTTGKGLADRRFTDAPAYEIDALAAKTVLEGDGVVRRLRVMLELGFFAWQQAAATQDDAVAYGAALQAVLRPGVQLDLQVRGYTGWQGNDSPLVVGLGASYALKPVRFLLTVNRGLTPPPLRTGTSGPASSSSSGSPTWPAPSRETGEPRRTLARGRRRV